jgi:hypothetical protein
MIALRADLKVVMAVQPVDFRKSGCFEQDLNHRAS